MKIIQATIDHVTNIRNILYERDKYPYTDTEIERLAFGFDIDKGLCFLVLQDDRTVGIALFEKRFLSQKGLDSQHWLYWENLYVSVNHRNGLAYAKIVRTVKDYSKANKFEGIYCAVHRPEVVQLHNKFGFDVSPAFKINFDRFRIRFFSQTYKSGLNRWVEVIEKDRGITRKLKLLSKQLENYQDSSSLWVNWTEQGLERRLVSRKRSIRTFFMLSDGACRIVRLYKILPFLRVAFELGERVGNTSHDSFYPFSGITVFFKTVHPSDRSIASRLFCLRQYDLVLWRRDCKTLSEITFSLLDHDAI